MFSLMDKVPSGIEPMLKDLEEHIISAGLADMVAAAETITTVSGENENTKIFSFTFCADVCLSEERDLPFLCRRSFINKISAEVFYFSKIPYFSLILDLHSIWVMLVQCCIVFDAFIS